MSYFSVFFLSAGSELWMQNISPWPVRWSCRLLFASPVGKPCQGTRHLKKLQICSTGQEKIVCRFCLQGESAKSISGEFGEGALTEKVLSNCP
uniref:Uncharacterized protein n=1 Tax=Aegilops tauschii subsp. strangulata TaxID=200361 RepID=A0A452XBT5_AEGTS